MMSTSDEERRILGRMLRTYLPTAKEIEVMTLVKPDGCGCICHLADYEQISSLTVLAILATQVMPPMADNVNGIPLVEGADRALDDIVQGTNVVNAPRTSRILSAIWRDVVWPARCEYRDKYRVSIRLTRSEESEQTAEEEADYLRTVQRGMMPHLRALHAIAVEQTAIDEVLATDDKRWAEWQDRVALANDQMAYCEEHHGQAAAVDGLLDGLVSV